jgi:nickel/cobalt transporter (NiCoT) family protein
VSTIPDELAPDVSRSERIGRLGRIRRSLGPREWTVIAAMAGIVVALHLVGWGVLLLFVSPRHFHLGNDQLLGFGVGLTAYTFGMRHAFDADHIAAIDNTTRKLMSEGKRPLSVGFFFSLGHSTIVFVASLLLGLGVHALLGQVADSGSTLHSVTGFVGTLVSGTFLYLIAGLNLIILVNILRVFREMRHGDYDEVALEQQLNNRGFMNRFLGRVTRSVDKPWKMYPVGVLFGLGFDTATEVALLVFVGSAASASLPWWAVLTLPILFAAGMSLFDTIDGCFMNFAYGWSFSKPVRKVFYNITITGLSVAVAALIGTIELLAIVQHQFSLTGPIWNWIAGIDLNVWGYVIVALFVATWLVALGVWRYGRIEEKWSAHLREPESALGD